MRFVRTSVEHDTLVSHLRHFLRLERVVEVTPQLFVATCEVMAIT